MRPMLASLGQTIPTGPGWMHEIKWDGMRALATVAQGALRLHARSEREVTSSFPELAGLTAVAPDIVLDGEILCLRDGVPSFSALASRMHVAAPTPELLAAAPVTYVVFDLLRLDGHDVTVLPLADRRELLERLDLAGHSWHLSPRFDDGPALLTATAERGLEGVVSKRLSSRYEPGVRSTSWLKFPHRPTASFVVGGWRPESTGGSRLGAVLLGTPTPDGLRFRGRMGSGLAGAAGEALATLLVEAPGSPFVDDVPRADVVGTRWVEPTVVIDVASLGESPDGRLRQPTYQGVRPDLTPADLLAPSDEDEGPGATADPAPEAEAPTPSRGTKATEDDSAPREPHAATADPSDGGPEGPMSGGVAAREAGATKERPRLAGRQPRSEAGRPEPRRGGVSSPDKVMYAQTGTTKAEVAAYYAAVADRILEQLRDRPVTRIRWPHGTDGAHFFEKNVPKGLPATIERVTLPAPGSTKDRELVTYPLLRSVDDLVTMASLGALELHTPQWRVVDGAPQHPDRLVVDLDPGPPAGLHECARVALLVRARLADVGLTCEPVTSGSKGLQLYAPLDGGLTSEEARAVAKALAELLTAEHPDLVLSTMRRDLRPGKVLLDWSQNTAAKTTITPWSLRGRAQPWVACPRTWAEVEAGAAGEPFGQVLCWDALTRPLPNNV